MKDTDIIAAIAPDAVSLMDKAIAEIKRLRQENATLTAEHDALRAERDEARRERDSARRMYCSEMAHDGNSPADVAEALGWDITRKEANV